MDPKPPPWDITQNHQQSILQNQTEEDNLLLNPNGTNSNNELGRQMHSNTLEKLRAKMLGLAPVSRMPPDQKLRIEQGFTHFFPNLTLPKHPPYASMIHRAITELNEVGGSSEEAISLFIKEKYNSLPWAHATLLRCHLQKLCENGEVVVTDEKCYMRRNGSLIFGPNHSFTPNEIRTPVSSYSPSSSSNSTSDYSPHAKRRQQKRRTRSGKYRNRHGRTRGKSDYEEESEKTEETSDETDKEEELVDTDDETEESFQITEEVEVTEIESEDIEGHKQVNRARGKPTKKYRTAEQYISGEQHIRVGVQHQHQLFEAYDRGAKPMRGRGRRPKHFGLQTNAGLKETQDAAIETHSPVTKDCKKLKQKGRRGRPPNCIGSETNIGLVETHKEVPEAHIQVKGDLKRTKRSRGSSRPLKNIGVETESGLKEVHKERSEALNQVTEDLMRPKKKGRVRLPKNTGVEIGEGAGRPKQKRGPGRPRNLSWMVTDLEHKEAQEGLIGPNNQVTVSEDKPLQQDTVPRQYEFKGLQSGEQIQVIEVHNEIIEDGKKLKQGGRRSRPRRHYNRKEDVKQKDLLEVIVVQDMMERMAIKSRKVDQNSPGEVFPGLTHKSHELLMEEKIRKDKEQQKKSAHGEIDIFDTYYLAQHPKKSDESMEKLSLTTVQLPQQGEEYDQLYTYQSHFQPLELEMDAYRAMEEMTPSQILWHADHQPKYIDQGARPNFEQVTTIASLTLPKYQAEDGWKQEQVKIGGDRFPETEEATAISTQLVHHEYQLIPHHQLDQSKCQCSDGCASHVPVHCSGVGAKSIQCND